MIRDEKLRAHQNPCLGNNEFLYVFGPTHEVDAEICYWMSENFDPLVALEENIEAETNTGHDNQNAT